MEPMRNGLISIRFKFQLVSLAVAAITSKDLCSIGFCENRIAKKSNS